ncbi:Bifunctional solanapyrone synthase [Lecanosticta acicola]|uniref:Bifunctional solanapyrone synthase n=1 Tax=Lecanosticta acicola TaxID=111012 RepID=A0AAI8Z4R9_9PEZI|nr:Bifunctional solanapyrone synthase [Lecanosticta acicola]
MRSAIWALWLAHAGAQRYNPSTSNQQQQPFLPTPCQLLQATFPDEVYGPGHANYTRSQANYWAAQQYDMTPACRFFPTGSRHIQEALADIIIPNNVSIAVVSGGHASTTGASNVEDGITIDLSRLTEVNFFLDAGKEVWLGPGNRWEDVYRILQPSNLTVAGSRSGHVGVGGHVLGGGLSWFANHRGWACDDVTEMELVTPSAEIVRVKPHELDDLFWSLKGSLGALGIVTKIKMKTVRNVAVYGGAMSYEQRYIAKLCRALERLASAAGKDPSTQGYLSFAWLEAKKSFTYSAYLMNTDNSSTSDALSAFETIPHSGNTLRSMTIGDSAKEIDQSNPLGKRRSKFTLTTLANAQVMMELHEIVKAVATDTTFDKEGVLGVTFQPLTVPHLQAQSNIFNLSPAQGPLLLISVEFWWSDRSRDPSIESAAQKLLKSMKAKLQELGALHDFIYPNYAARDQNPLDSLTPLNRRMLQQTKRKFDPQNLWQQLVPGIWHID